MPFTTGIDNVRLYYKETGQGTPLVFLHGFTLDHRMWTAQREYFSKRYRVVVLDARGHGKSDAPPTNYSRDIRVEDLRLTLDQLGIDRCHMVGLSMGGSTGILFALKYPERLKSLTLVSSGAAGWNVGKKLSRIDELARTKGKDAALEQWLEWALQWYKGKERFRAVAQLLEEIMREHSGTIWADPMRGKYPRMTDLEHVHRIKVPTLIMAGELDRVFVSLAKELHKKIEGSRYIMYPGVGHMVNLEIPERFNQELIVYLTSIEAEVSE